MLTLFTNNCLQPNHLAATLRLGASSRVHAILIALFPVDTMKINLPIMVALLVSTCRTSGASQPVQPTAANILQRCQQMYAALHSYSESADVVVHSPSGTVTQKIELILMRPNYLLIKVIAEGGVREVCSNGKQFTVYVPTANRYSVGPTSATLKGVLDLLATQAQMGTIFNGLYFAAGKLLPANLKNPKLARTQVLNGKIYGTVTAFVPASKSKARRKSVDVNWTWFINMSTNQILRTDALSSPFTITVPVLSKSKGKMVGHPVTMHLEVHSAVTKSTLNPLLTAADFTIHMKPGAQRIGSFSQGR